MEVAMLLKSYMVTAGGVVATLLKSKIIRCHNHLDKPNEQAGFSLQFDVEGRS